MSRNSYLVVAIASVIVFCATFYLIRGADTGSRVIVQFNSPVQEIGFEERVTAKEGSGSAMAPPSLSVTDASAQRSKYLSVDSPSESTAQAGGEGGPVAQADNSRGLAGGVDFSVVGRKFPMSASVLWRCNPAGLEGLCEKMVTTLNQLSEQPRDSEWASLTERQITEYLQRTEREVFQARAVECRSTLCALEVVAPYQHLLGEVEKDPVLKDRFRFITADIGTENEKGLEERKVTVLLFRRESEARNPTKQVR